MGCPQEGGEWFVFGVVTAVMLLCACVASCCAREREGRPKLCHFSEEGLCLLEEESMHSPIASFHWSHLIQEPLIELLSARHMGTTHYSTTESRLDRTEITTTITQSKYGMVSSSRSETRFYKNVVEDNYGPWHSDKLTGHANNVLFGNFLATYFNVPLVMFCYGDPAFGVAVFVSIVYCLNLLGYLWSIQAAFSEFRFPTKKGLA